MGDISWGIVVYLILSILTKSNSYPSDNVALIVTVILLLILSGISIAQLTGNGLFKKTLKAEEESNLAQILEHIKLIVYEKNIEKRSHKGIRKRN